MKIFRNLDEVPEDFPSTVLSVGNFDGVHCAHQKVLREVLTRAHTLKARAMAITFDPHPTKILRPELAPKLITPLSEKLRLLEETRLDAVLVMPFTSDLSLMPPRDFAKNILKGRLNVLEVHEGVNFHFGHRAEGNVSKLAEFGSEFHFDVKIYPEIHIRGKAVSSSSIRNLLSEGKVAQARHLLGRCFEIVARPAHGRGYGHKYTVPTINLGPYDELIPGNGVYITRTRINDDVFDSLTNIGVRPTFGEDSFAIESHLFDFHEIDVTTDTKLHLSFLQWLRPETKWPTVESLKKQIAKDVAKARRYFHLEKLWQGMVTQHKQKS